MFDEVDLMRRGEAFREKKDYDQAIAIFSEVIKINPRFAEAYYARGNCYEEQGLHEEAIANYNEVLRFS
ncbi:MAG TPA: tetratricopeptide repeat protein, partial [Thermoguttaceae bacterium]|nr:tetratricopeptide repeat protein [Thermoguttaceae bacterium]